MPVELLILIGAILISWLVFTALLKVVKTTLSTAITVAVIVLILQLAFGVSPQAVWQQITHLPETILRLVTGD